jgi:hypothetical protein
MPNASKYLNTNSNINAQKLAENKELQVPLVIEKVEVDKIGEDEKLVLIFTSVDDRLVLNKTNLKTMIKAKGADTNKWDGAQVLLELVNTTFNGNATKGVLIVKVV